LTLYLFDCDSACLNNMDPHSYLLDDLFVGTVTLQHRHQYSPCGHPAQLLMCRADITLVYDPVTFVTPHETMYWRVTRLV